METMATMLREGDSKMRVERGWIAKITERQKGHKMKSRPTLGTSLVYRASVRDPMRPMRSKTYWSLQEFLKTFKLGKKYCLYS